MDGQAPCAHALGKRQGLCLSLGVFSHKNTFHVLSGRPPNFLPHTVSRRPAPAKAKPARQAAPDLDALPQEGALLSCRPRHLLPAHVQLQGRACGEGAAVQPAPEWLSPGGRPGIPGAHPSPSQAHGELCAALQQHFISSHHSWRGYCARRHGLRATATAADAAVVTPRRHQHRPTHSAGAAAAPAAACCPAPWRCCQSQCARAWRSWPWGWRRRAAAAR